MQHATDWNAGRENAEQRSTFSGWVILELMGHRRLGGFLQEVELAGQGVLRLDIPGEKPGEVVATQFYSPAALYCMTPTTEEIARKVAKSNRPEPVHRWELPLLPEDE